MKINDVETKKKPQKTEINETRNWFFEKIHNFDQPLTRVISKEGEDPNK